MIGVKLSIILDPFTIGLPVRHEFAKGPVRIGAFLIDLDPQSGRAHTAQLIQHPPGRRVGNGAVAPIRSHRTPWSTILSR